jgi:pSer/pThr/pTyr-binding forkhead associated (FHA) protein
MRQSPPTDYVLYIASERKLRSKPLPSSGLLTVGRSRLSDIRLGDRLVSAHHAVLGVGTRFTITDLGSRNGTSIESRRIPALHAIEIHPGQAVFVGNTLLVIESRSGARVADPHGYASKADTG